MKVLVTGGAGYIGSVTATALEFAGHVPIIIDSLVNGPRAFVGRRAFYHGDIADQALLRRIMEEHPDIDLTIHMAARVVVAESLTLPELYYRDNVGKSLALFGHLVSLHKPRIIYSSSASVYDAPDSFKVNEESRISPRSPYARTKWMTETLLRDIAEATELRGVILRYFNPLGSDPNLSSGFHERSPSHVAGQLAMVSNGLQETFTLTGVNYATRDGTGLRDYIPVWDLARAHVLVAERLDDILATVGAPTSTINIGTGKGVTVRELVALFELAGGRPIPVCEAPTRQGDVAGAVANVEKAQELLGWMPACNLHDAVLETLAWGRRRKAILGYG